MHSTYLKGHLAVLACQKRALELGFVVCFPVVECRYDAIFVSPEGKCFRVQIKYAGCELKNCKGSFSLDLRKQTRNNGIAKTYMKDEIDVILAYVPSRDKVLWINSDIFHERKSLALRFDKTKNGQRVRTLDVNSLIW